MQTWCYPLVSSRPHELHIFPRLRCVEYPNQDLIERAVAFDHSSDKRQRLIDHITAVGKSLPDTLDKYNIDVIIGPADSCVSQYSAATGISSSARESSLLTVLGLPLCSLPLGYINYNGRPIGLMALARSEVTLITLMSAFEATFPPRKAPSAFLREEGR